MQPVSEQSQSFSAEFEGLLAEIAPASSTATRRALADAARIRTFARGEVIVAQGEPTTLGLVIDGLAAARRTTPDGRAVMHLIVRTGSVIGTMVLAGRETLFDLVALAPGVAAFWSGPEIRSMAAADAGLALGLLDRVLMGVGELAGRLDTLHYQDARMRVARVLVQYRDLCFGERPPVARAQLSLLVGTSREMTGRVLRRLEASGAIRRVGRAGLELRDEDLLRELAGLGHGGSEDAEQVPRNAG